MTDNAPHPWGSRRATRDEIRFCAKAIDRAFPGVVPAGRWPAEVYVAGDEQPPSFYVNYVARENVPIGKVYRTWIVIGNEFGQPSVSWFRSRRGETGDPTLPPGKDDEDATLPPSDPVSKKDNGGA